MHEATSYGFKFNVSVFTMNSSNLFSNLIIDAPSPVLTRVIDTSVSQHHFQAKLNGNANGHVINLE